MLKIAKFETHAKFGSHTGREERNTKYINLESTAAVRILKLNHVDSCKKN